MIYLDHAATSLPRRVVALEAHRNAVHLASPGRGRHGAEQKSAALLERARATVGRLCPGGTLCFVSGTTHALSQAITGLRPRPRAVALGPLVHNAVWRPASALGVPLWTLPSDARGRVDVDAARATWRHDVDLVVVTHGSNVNGVLQPVAKLAELAHARGARLLVDAAQTAGLVSLDLGADLVAFGAHKGVGALPGVGALVVCTEVELEPSIRGGVGFDSSQPDVPGALPHRLESGTMNLPGIAAFAAGAAAALETTWDWRAAARLLCEALERGGASPHGGELPIASFVPSMEIGLAEQLFDRVYDIAARGGLHCAPRAHATLGTADTGMLRVSAGPDTSAEMLLQLTEAVRAVRVAGG